MELFCAGKKCECACQTREAIDGDLRPGPVVANYGDPVFNTDPDHLGCRVGAYLHQDNEDPDFVIVQSNGWRARWVKTWIWVIPDEELITLWEEGCVLKDQRPIKYRGDAD